MSNESLNKIVALVEYIVAEGTENTSGGNWIVYFEEIPESLMSRQELDEAMEEIKDALLVRKEVIEVEVTEEAFDVIYATNYCPNVELSAEEQEEALLEQLREAVYTQLDNIEGIAGLPHNSDDFLAEIKQSLAVMEEASKQIKEDIKAYERGEYDG